jgi:hypothetical protein
VIVATPARLLSRHYRVETPAGPWTELRFDDHAANAAFVVDGRSYRALHVRDESVWRTVVRGLRGRNLYQLEQDGAVVARATGGGLGARYHVWTEAGPEYELREAGKQVQLLRDGVPMGELGRRPGLSRGLWAEISADVPAPVRLFAIWLLLCRWETVHST